MAWYDGGGAIPSGNVLEHVESPATRQAYAGASIASGHAWTIFALSTGFVHSSSHYLFDSQTGRVILGNSGNAAYAFHVSGTWANVALIEDTQPHYWFLISDGANVQGYLDGTAVGSTVSGAGGINVSGSSRWRGAYDNTTGADWTNAVPFGAIYDIALNSTQRAALVQAIGDTFNSPITFTATDLWIAPTNVTQVTAEMYGGGGGGGGISSATQSASSGGGGGGYSKGVVSVTPGTAYRVTINQGGAGGATSTGTSGGASSLTGDSGNVTAAGGVGGSSGTGGTGGAGSGGTITNQTGGAGGVRGGTVASNSGGGGGGSAGTASTGNAGQAGHSADSSPGTGATAVTGGAAGGDGGGGNIGGGGTSAVAGSVPGGGGGGTGGGTVNRAGGNGARGQGTLSWTANVATAVHQTVERGVGRGVMRGAR